MGGVWVRLKRDQNIRQISFRDAEDLQRLCYVLFLPKLRPSDAHVKELFQR